MADVSAFDEAQIENLTVAGLLDHIAHLETSPPIYDVRLRAASHSSVFTASVNFRTNSRGLDVVSTQDELAKKALLGLRNILLEKYGKCPCCGRFEYEK